MWHTLESKYFMMENNTFEDSISNDAAFSFHVEFIINQWEF